MTQPFRKPPTPSRLPVPPSSRPKVTPNVDSQSLIPASGQIQRAESEPSPSEHDEASSSDHDADSTAGDSGVDSSWVSLNGSQTHLHGEAAA